MKTLALNLPDQTAAKLQEAAERMNLSLEELMILSLEEKLQRLDKEFESASDHVLGKNAELYRRLA